MKRLLSFLLCFLILCLPVEARRRWIPKITSTPPSGPAVISANVKTASVLSSGSPTFTVSGVDCTGANALYVMVASADGSLGAGITGVTYNSVAMTPIWSKLNLASTTIIAMYRLLAPTTGSNNLVVTYLSAAGDQSVAAVPMSGVNQTTPEGTSVTGSSETGAATSASITTSSASGELVLSFLFSAEVATAGGTSVFNFDDTDGEFYSGQTVPGSGSVNSTWTFAASPWWGGSTPIKP